MDPEAICLGEFHKDVEVLDILLQHRLSKRLWAKFQPLGEVSSNCAECFPTFSARFSKMAWHFGMIPRLALMESASRPMTLQNESSTLGHETIRTKNEPILGELVSHIHKKWVKSINPIKMDGFIINCGSVGGTLTIQTHPFDRWTSWKIHMVSLYNVLPFLKGKSLKSFVNHCIFLSTSSMDNNPHFHPFPIIFYGFSAHHSWLRLTMASLFRPEALMSPDWPAQCPHGWGKPSHEWATFHREYMGILWEYYGNIVGILWEYMGIYGNIPMVYDGLWWFMEYHENLNHHKPSFFPWFWQFCPANTSDKAFF